MNAPASTYIGRLELRTLFAGSRSERVAPVLVTDDDAIPIYVIGDNPFENASLQELIGCRLRVEGSFRNKTLRVAPGGIETMNDTKEPSNVDGDRQGDP